MNRRSQDLLTLALCLVMCMFLFAARITTAQSVYTGKVIDAATGTGLASVNVFVPGTTVGTATDRLGEFRLRTDVQPETIAFSRMGYRTVLLNNGFLEESLLVEMVATHIDLSPVVVTASREAEPRSRTPSSVSILSMSQLDQEKPSVLYQALNQIAGVHMVDLGNEQYKLSIRQPFTNKAYFLFLEDGIPLRPTGIFNPNALIDINMAGIDRIEVLRGPVSAMYGSNAVAGALNFITPTPGATSGTSVSARLDNRGYKRTDFSTATRKGKLGVFIGGYAARQRDAWFDHSDFDKIALTLRTDYQLSSSTMLETAITASYLDSDTNGALDSLNFFTRNVSSLHTFTYREMGSVRARASLSRIWSDRSRTRITSHFRNASISQLPYYKVRNKRTNPSEATGEINEDAFWSMGLIGQQEVFFPELRARLVVGASIDVSPATYRAEYIDVQKDDAGRYASYVTMDSSLTDYAVRISNTAAFAQFEVTPAERLRLVSSLRFDQLGYRYDNHLDPTAYSGAPDENSTFHRLSPKIGITYDLGQGRGLYANYSLGFVPPEVNELYVGVKIPQLKSALFGSYEVGGWIAAAGGKLFVDLSLYAMNGTDEIIPVILDDGARENRNAGRTRHRGIEYTLLYQPSSWVSVRVSGTNALHVFIQYNENGSDYSGNTMMNAPGWTANGEVWVSPPGMHVLKTGVEWQHVGAYELDNGNTADYSGYNVVNARASVTLRSVEMWITVNNVFDTVYATTAAAYAFGTLYNVGQVRTVAIGGRLRM